MPDNKNNEKTLQVSENDLKLFLSIISVAQSRGAFKVSECTTVGAIYDKYSSMMEDTTTQEQSEEEENLKENG